MKAPHIIQGGLLIVCACGKMDSKDFLPSRPIVADAIVRVENRTKSDVSVFIETDRLVDMLGAVPGNASRSFSIPSTVARSGDDLFLEARGDRAPRGIRSSRFRLSMGVRVVWTIDETRAGTLTAR